MSDDDDLNTLLKTVDTKQRAKLKKIKSLTEGDKYNKGDPDESTDDFNGGVAQWATSDGKAFIPTGFTTDELTPGCYEIVIAPSGNLFFSKIKVKIENLIRFPDSATDKVIEEIKTFWNKKDIFKDHGIPFKRGVVLYGAPGCHAAGTNILMFDGSLKKVEDIKVGDELMGPDSTPRKVLELRRGEDEMVRITPKKGESFDVNVNHVLSLQKSGDREKNFPGVLNVSVNDFRKMSVCAQETFKLRKTAIAFQNSNEKLPIDPYILGVWLGDGTSISSALTSADKEISDAWIADAQKRGLKVRINRKTDSIAHTYAMSGNTDNGKIENSFLKDLRKLNLFDNKHIPQEYLSASVEDRLQLLAGFVDTDGSYSKVSYREWDKIENVGRKFHFDVIQVREHLTRQFVQLASSLGFGTSIRKCKKGIKSRDFIGDYWRISIFGEIEKVPTRLPRKQALIGRPNKDPLRTGIKSIESLGKGNYYGFTLDKDHLYLTGDYFIHHNCGKSTTIQLIMQDIVDRKGLVVKFTEPRTFITGMRLLRQIQPEVPVVVIMEDLDSILEIYNESDVLNLLDGVDQIENCVFLATTNYPERLGPRIINRPSRFDKRFCIKFPNPKARKMYFEYLFKGTSAKDSGVDITQWVKDTKDMSFAHMKELFVAVFILGDEYKEAVETLKKMKESLSSDRDEESKFGFGD